MTKKQLKTKNRALMVAVGLLGTLAIGSGLVRAYSGSASVVVENVENMNISEQSGEVFGSVELPDCANSDYFTNCPSTKGNQFLEGGLEADAASYFDATLTIGTGLTVTAGDTNVDNFVKGGDVAAATVTSTLTAANLCDSNLITVTPVTTTPTITLPATTTLFADCLTANYDDKVIVLESVNTSSIFAAGTGGTLDVSSSATLTADKSAILTIIRDSATTYRAILVNANS